MCFHLVIFRNFWNSLRTYNSAFMGGTSHQMRCSFPVFSGKVVHQRGNQFSNVMSFAGGICTIFIQSVTQMETQVAKCECLLSFFGYLISSPIFLPLRNVGSIHWRLCHMAWEAAERLECRLSVCVDLALDPPHHVENQWRPEVGSPSPCKKLFWDSVWIRR